MTIRTIVGLGVALSVGTASAQALPEPAPPQKVVRAGPPPPVISGESARLPMTLQSGVPSVEVMVNGKGPFRFMIDTGAQPHALISPKLAETLGLEPFGEALLGDPSGVNPRRLKLYKLDSLKVGGLTFAGVVSPSLSLLKGDTDGVLGLALFRDLLLTIDYGRGEMSASKGMLPPADGLTILDYQVTPAGLIGVPLQLGESRHVLNLDTGAGHATIAVPKARLAGLSTTGTPRVVGKARTASQEFEISAVKLAVPVRFGSTRLAIDEVSYPSPGNGLIGSKALAGFTVAIDQKNRRIRIVPTTN